MDEPRLFIFAYGSTFENLNFTTSRKTVKFVKFRALEKKLAIRYVVCTWVYVYTCTLGVWAGTNVAVAYPTQETSGEELLTFLL